MRYTTVYTDSGPITVPEQIAEDVYGVKWSQHESVAIVSEAEAAGLFGPYGKLTQNAWAAPEPWQRAAAPLPTEPKPLPPLHPLAKRPLCEMDTECDAHWWLIKFYPEGAGGQMWSYSISAESREPLAYAHIQYFIDNYTLVTFNGVNYDIPMVRYAMAGADVFQLKQLNDRIIVGGLKHWHFADQYPMATPLANLDHIDVMEPTPGVRIGLKTYMGRMHSPTLQELPFDPLVPMPVHMRAVTDKYCGNDLMGTRQLREEIAGRLALRVKMSERYGVDLRSKSDAQMAEAAIRARLPFKPEKRYVPHGYTFRYEPPAFVKFVTPQMQEVLRIVTAAQFVVNDIDQVRDATGLTEIYLPDGKKMKTGVLMPPELKTLLVPLGGNAFQFGIGGLHSTESSVSHYTLPGQQTVSDHDVKSYYPSLILLLAMYPEQLGPVFLAIYREFYDSRLYSKDLAGKLDKLLKTLEADPTRAAEVAQELAEHSANEKGLKIFLNGAFGKLFSKYSIMFAPELGIRVTITGQLSLLMLIESMTLRGIRVVSANTDGIVLVTPAGLEWARDDAIAWWERTTGLEMEATFYKAIHMRDVNSYVAFTTDGKTKSKGAFAKSGVENNVHPERDVCTDAVMAYLRDGKRMEETIHGCADLRRFLVIRNVKGGGYDDAGQYLGKTVRWYYRKGCTTALRYKPKAHKTTGVMQEIGNAVAGSQGAAPCQVLPPTLPDDIDYDHYLQYAVKSLATLGVDYPAATGA